MRAYHNDDIFSKWADEGQALWAIGRVIDAIVREDGASELVLAGIVSIPVATHEVLTVHAPQCCSDQTELLLDTGLSIPYFSIKYNSISSADKNGASSDALENNYQHIYATEK